MHADPSAPDPVVIFHAHFTSDAISVASILEGLINATVVHCQSADRMGDIEIVLAEVVNNIVEHAYRGTPGRPIEARAELYTNSVQFRFVDRGCQMPGGVLPAGSPPELNTRASDLPEGGFGWYLIRTLADDLHYIRKNGENYLSVSVTFGESQTASCR